MLVQNLDVKADALLGGESIHVPADGIDLSGYVLGRAMLGAFENHVLDEMGDAIPLCVFVARSALDPNTDRGRTNMLHLFGNHGQPVGQQFPLDVTHFFHHNFSSPTAPRSRPHRAPILLHTLQPSRERTTSYLESISCEEICAMKSRCAVPPVSSTIVERRSSSIQPCRK